MKRINAIVGLVAFISIMMFCFVQIDDKFPKGLIQKNMKNETSQFNMTYDEKTLDDICELLKGIHLNNIKDFVHVLVNLKYDSSDGCAKIKNVLFNIYDIHLESGILKMSPSFENKMRKWMNNNNDLIKEASNQQIIFIRNKITREETVINTIRSKKPGKTVTNQLLFINKLSQLSAKNCDFCNYSLHTAEESFGRIETEQSFTMANAFKLGVMHGLVVFKNHHPLNWNKVQFTDVFMTAKNWFHSAFISDKELGRFRTIIWDLLPRASASQVHPHIHVIANKHSFHGGMHFLKESIEEYKTKTGRHYLHDLIYLYKRLHMCFSYGSTTVLVNIAPVLDNEIIIISEQLDLDFIEITHEISRIFIDELHENTFSMAIALPPETNIPTSLPLYARLVTRGKASDTVSDVSAIHLFTSSNVNIDIIKFAHKLKHFVQKKVTKQEKLQFF